MFEGDYNLQRQLLLPEWLRAVLHLLPTIASNFSCGTPDTTDKWLFWYPLCPPLVVGLYLGPFPPPNNLAWALSQKYSVYKALTMPHVSHPSLVSLSFHTIPICLFFNTTTYTPVKGGKPPINIYNRDKCLLSSSSFISMCAAVSKSEKWRNKCLRLFVVVEIICGCH